MDDKELARKDAVPRVVSSAPDVCKSPTAPVPYPIVATFAPSVATVPTVRATGMEVFTLASRIPVVRGDEGGAGGGVKSGTFAGGGVCEPIGSSGTVRVQGNFAVRHGDPFLMNNGNTVGTAVYQPGGGPRATVTPAGGVAGNSNPPVTPETPEETGFFAGLKKSIGDTVDDVKSSATTLWDATGLTATSEATAAARASIRGGVESLGNLAGDVGSSVLPTEAGAAARGRLADLGGNIAGQVRDRYADAYAQGGVSQALGVGTGDSVRLLAEAFVGGKGAGLVAKGAAKGAGAARKLARGVAAVDKVEDAADLAGDVKKLEGAVSRAEDGTDGVRVFRRPKVIKVMSREEAAEWYRKHYPEKYANNPEALESHLAGTDWSKPVELVELPEGTPLIQYQHVRDNIPRQGMYAASPGTLPSELAIVGEGRRLGQFVTNGPVEVLRSTAAPFEIGKFPGVGGPGGGIQFILPPNWGSMVRPGP